MNIQVLFQKIYRYLTVIFTQHKNAPMPFVGMGDAHLQHAQHITVMIQLAYQEITLSEQYHPLSSSYWNHQNKNELSDNQHQKYQFRTL